MTPSRNWGAAATSVTPSQALWSICMFLRESSRIQHGPQLKEVDNPHGECKNQPPQSNVEGVRFADFFRGHLSCFFLLLIRLTECLFWFGLCYLCGRLNILSCGGRSSSLFLLTLVLLAVSAA